MKIRIVRVVAFLAVVFLFSKCTGVLVANGGLPPGQAKKVTGSQSAKSNAPGQQKKAAGAQSAKEFAPGQQKKKK
jgi:hypothetical protein